MINRLGKTYDNLFFKILLPTGLTLLLGLSVLIYLTTHSQKQIQVQAIQGAATAMNRGLATQPSAKQLVVYALCVFGITIGVIIFFLQRFVRRPIKKMIEEVRKNTANEHPIIVGDARKDELGDLTRAINRMKQKIAQDQKELNRRRDEYQTLFELVPCTITVQDRDYKLIQYNREFAEKFHPNPGDHCYRAYKGREFKCEICPVEKTFRDGRSHVSEETGSDKGGTLKHWIVKTTPIKNADGETIAAMEVNLDITSLKELEEELVKSQKKYYEIFNNIPNPVFILDADTLEILDCNENVNTLYGYAKSEIVKMSFLDLFADQPKDQYEKMIKNAKALIQVKHVNKAGKHLFVNIRISLSEYSGQRVLVATTNDITKRLEAEQQLIQASKMATLGEMATGVAHELNQPLSVIKTASSFFMKKIKKGEPIDDEILFTMAGEIDSHVDRATKIINHMRQFGRKSDHALEMVQLNETLKRTLEILGQQLKLRGIEIEWDLDPNLPMIKADPSRIEQVFINLLINARDAIDDLWKSQEAGPEIKKITLRTRTNKEAVAIEITDTGRGIPKANLEKIFEPFFTTKSTGQGTGLGLSISYNIIKECGGNIQAASIENDGTSFIIRLPIQDTYDEENRIAGR